MLLAERFIGQITLGDQNHSDLFEHFIYVVKYKPRRELAEFLPGYLYKTDRGAWLPPTSGKEEQIKVEGRAKGTGQRVKRYLVLLEQGAAIGVYRQLTTLWRKEPLLPQGDRGLAIHEQLHIPLRTLLFCPKGMVGHTGIRRGVCLSPTLFPPHSRNTRAFPQAFPRGPFPFPSSI